jgi:hypothetical protein
MKIIVTYVRFQVHTAASMKFRVFWDVLPCCQIDVDRRFTGASVSNIRLRSEPSGKDSWLYSSPVVWTDQWGMGDDR